MAERRQRNRFNEEKGASEGNKATVKAPPSNLDGISAGGAGQIPAQVTSQCYTSVEVRMEGSGTTEDSEK